MQHRHVTLSGTRHSTKALPALGLAAAFLAGCAQTPTAPAAGATPPESRPLVNFASCSKPVYPAEALANKVQGTSTLQFLINPEGAVVESRVQKSSGDRSLDEAARVAIAKCTFKPAVVGGKPQQAWVPVQYVWTI